MTWGEIKKQCIQLGFMKERDFLKKREAFFSSANWAQNQIAMYVKPIIKKLAVNSRAPENVLREKENSYKTRLYEGEPIVFHSLWARAFCFQCDGNGICKIEDDDGERVIALSSHNEFKNYRGFCKGKLKITFSGEYGYLIRNVAAYGITFSDNEEDIPFCDEYISYDFKKIDAAFMGFADKRPILKGSSKEEEITDYKLESSSILKLRGDQRGQFEVWYRVYPTPITADTPDSFIMEFEDNACGIIPYLMGFRLWLDDDMQRAVLYQNTAEDLIDKLMSFSFTDTPPKAFVDTEGAIWLN